MTLIQRTPIATSLCLALFSGTVVLSSKAETSPQAPTSSLPAVEVTATKQQRSAFETAASVSLIDADDLGSAGVQSLNEVAQQLPNVYFSDFSGGLGTIIIRGMGHGDEEADVASVGVQIDGVALPLTSLAGNLFDLDHVEVLRGPQSLLHGQGYIGGLIALRSRDPGFTFGGTAQIDTGSYGRQRAGAAVDLPMSKHTAMRVTLGRDQGDGYIDNHTLGSSNSTAWGSNYARLKLLHRDVADGELRLGLHHLNRNGGNDLFLRSQNVDTRQSIESETGINDIDYTVFSAEYSRLLNAQTRLSVAAGSSLTEWSYWLPSSVFGATNGYDMTLKSHHAEARIQRIATSSSRWDWMLGFHLAYTDMDRPYLYDYAPYFRSDTQSQVDATTLALFAEAGWHFKPQWRLAAGLRLSHDRRELEWISDQNGTIQSVQRDLNNTVLLPQLTLEYRPDDRQFGWAKLSRGYKAAGFNIYATSEVAAGDPYEAEYMNYAEIGYRVAAADDLWHVEATVFHAKLRDQQVVVQGLGGVTMTDNAGRSHSQGAELSATVRPLQTLELSGQIGYIKAVYDEYSRGTTNYADQQFSATPRNTVGASMTWRPTTAWELGVKARRIGRVYLQTNRQLDDAYTLVDAHLSWNGKGWTATVYGKNLSDANYLTRAIDDGTGNSLSVSGAPRTYGVSLAYDF